jgi:hypothetical protein
MRFDISDLLREQQGPLVQERSIVGDGSWVYATKSRGALFEAGNRSTRYRGSKEASMKLAFFLAAALLVSAAPASAAGAASSGQRLVTIQGDGVYPFVDGFSVPAGACTKPFTDLGQIAANLRSAFVSEKAYFQEKDHFAPLATVGFSPEAGWPVYCWQYVVTLAHITFGNTPAPTFFVTARQKTGIGPTLCVSSEHISGQINESSTGVIATATACGNLPQAQLRGFNMAPAPFATKTPGIFIAPGSIVIPRPSQSPVRRIEPISSRSGSFDLGRREARSPSLRDVRFCPRALRRNGALNMRASK